MRQCAAIFDLPKTKSNCYWSSWQRRNNCAPQDLDKWNFCSFCLKYMSRVSKLVHSHHLESPLSGFELSVMFQRASLIKFVVFFTDLVVPGKWARASKSSSKARVPLTFGTVSCTYLRTLGLSVYISESGSVSRASGSTTVSREGTAPDLRSQDNLTSLKGYQDDIFHVFLYFTSDQSRIYVAFPENVKISHKFPFITTRSIFVHQIGAEGYRRFWNDGST